ncbi:MAG: hypothetical protein R3F05_15595 [Planctomycetota bacterium]
MLDGLPDAIAVALDAIAYFDVAPLQVLVEAKILRTKRWEEEAPDTPGGKDDDEGESEEDEEGEIERRGNVETLAMPSVVVAIGNLADVSLESNRPVLTQQSANQGGVNRINSSTHEHQSVRKGPPDRGRLRDLELSLTLEDLDPNSALVVPDGAEVNKAYRLKTTVTIPDGESVVVSRNPRADDERRGDAVPPPTGPGLALIAGA